MATLLLNTGTASYNDLISNGRAFSVPPYQRDYSWEKEYNALRSKTVRTAIEEAGFVLGSFTDLTSMTIQANRVDSSKTVQKKINKTTATHASKEEKSFLAAALKAMQ